MEIETFEMSALTIKKRKNWVRKLKFKDNIQSKFVYIAKCASFILSKTSRESFISTLFFTHFLRGWECRQLWFDYHGNRCLVAMVTNVSVTYCHVIWAGRHLWLAYPYIVDTHFREEVNTWLFFSSFWFFFPFFCFLLWFMIFGHLFLRIFPIFYWDFNLKNSSYLIYFLIVNLFFHCDT